MRFAKPCSLALLAALLLAAPPAATAGWGWGPVFKPDLHVIHMGPSLVSPNHVRFLVKNSGWATSKTCFIRATCYGPTTTTGVGYVPTVLPGQIVSLDAWVGQQLDANPGQMSVGWVDCYQAVTESNEGNNLIYHYAPPH